MSCNSPFYVKNPRPWEGERELPVPCGRCLHCIKRRTNAWVFRLMQEDKVSEFSHFVTLTYDTDHVPITKNGFMTLVKTVKHINTKGNLVDIPHELSFQSFMKRLRKYESRKLRYYAVGEYGGTTARPHYHAIIFNVENPDNYLRAWMRDGKSIGTIHVGDVSGDSIGYTAGYIQKGKIVPAHSRDDRLQEFSLMSKGLGKNYLSDEVKTYHKSNYKNNFLTLEGGVKIPMPKYYRDKIFNDDEKEKIRRHIAEEMERVEQEKIVEFERKKNRDGDKDYHMEQRNKNYVEQKRFDKRQKDILKRNKI